MSQHARPPICLAYRPTRPAMSTLGSALMSPYDASTTTSTPLAHQATAAEHHHDADFANHRIDHSVATSSVEVTIPPNSARHCHNHRPRYPEDRAADKIIGAAHVLPTQSPTAGLTFNFSHNNKSHDELLRRITPGLTLRVTCDALRVVGGTLKLAPPNATQAPHSMRASSSRHH